MRYMKINTALPPLDLPAHLKNQRALKSLGILVTALLVSICLPAIVLAQLRTPNAAFISYVPPARTLEPISALERRVFDLVNIERTSRGLRPLIWIDEAAATARDHSRHMAENSYLGHRDLAGKGVGDRSRKFGVKDWRWIGENIAWVSGQDDPATRVIECWMGSRGHRENILRSKFREGGIGMALAADGKYYFTQVFVLRQ